MAGIFPPEQKGGQHPGPNICNGYLPTNPVIGEGPLYYSPDCTTFLTDCSMNSLASEILAAVDALGFGYNADRINNLGEALVSKFALLDSKVNKTGDTMTGPLLVPCPPSDDREVACKFYVDTKLDACCFEAGNKIDTAIDNFQTALNGKVNRSGDFMTGSLLLSGDPTLPGHAANKNYIDAEVSNRVRRDGDTMTGRLYLFDDPLAPNESVNKRYVDALAFGGGAAAGVIVAPTAPVSVPANTLWFNTTDGLLYLWLNGRQWVAVSGTQITTPEVQARTLFEFDQTSIEAGWEDRNIRVVLPPSINEELSGRAYLQIELVFASGTNATLSSAWVGYQGTGLPYSFDGNQMQLRFGGDTQLAVAAASYLSDPIQFQFHAARSLVVAFHLAGTSAALPIYDNTEATTYYTED